MSFLINVFITLTICAAVSLLSSDWPDDTCQPLSKKTDVGYNVFDPDPDCNGFTVQDQASIDQTPRRAPPRDYFKCGHCSCFNCSGEGDVAATCTKHVPYVMTKMPQNLPVKTISLNMNGNQLYNFTLEDVTRYRTITYLKVRNNKIDGLFFQPCKSVASLVLLDLFGNLLVSIDDGWFTCLGELIHLNLGNNQLTTVSNQTFLGLSSLKYLDLSGNRLRQIQYGAFDSCDNLKTLNLGKNPLSYSSRSFHPRLFQPLKRLEVLSIQKFLVYSLHYPLSALLQLTSLKELSVDEANEDYFGKDYQALKSMSTLKLGVDGSCDTIELVDNYFIGFPFLKTIQINGCSPRLISPLAFESNLELDTLNYTGVKYNFEDLFGSLSGVTHLNLSILVVNNIPSGQISRTLSSQHVRNIQNLQHLKELHLEGNWISTVSFDFVKGLPSSLRRINLSRNNLYRDNSILKYVYTSQNLAYLEILNEDLENTFSGLDTVPHFGASDSCQCDILTPESDNTVKNPSPQHLQHSKIRPQHLKMYTAIGTSQFNKNIFSYQAVQVINISGAFPTRWGDNRLPTSVKVADFTNNYYDHWENSFCLTNNSLEELHVGGNFLGGELSDDVFGRKLARLPGLRYLDLSRNQIQELPWKVFIGLARVNIIILSKNKIQKLDVNMSHLINLDYLDLSWNSVTWISEATRGHLDTIALHREVSLNLAFNPIPCTCTGIDFLKWLATTNVRIVDKDYMVCVDDKSERKALGDLKLMASTLQRKCASQVNLVLASSFSCAVFVILISSLLLFRNRWRLYYIKNLVITRWYGYKPGDQHKTGKFTFDAYVLYSKLDRHFVLRDCLAELEEKRGHKLCIEDRDFLVGSFLPCNITSAIQNSHLTLAIISPDFWDCEWTEYGTHMSIMESLYSKRQILHLLLYKPFPVEEMPRDLIKVHKDNRFIEYPPRESIDDAKVAFWNALSLMIGHTENMEENPVLQV